MSIEVGQAPYTSRIIKAGALLADTKLLLLEWDEAADVPANLARFRQENLFGKASRARIEDILKIFRRRYLRDAELLPALVTLAKGTIGAETLNRILYFQAARADQLLHDAVTDLLVPLTGRPDAEIRLAQVVSWVGERVAAGQTERAWSSYVQERVAQGLMATLRDFGVLEGASKKRIASVYLPIEAFAFVAFQLNREARTGEWLLHDSEWKLFLIPNGVVERFMLEAHQERLLQYHAAGRVTRIDFPAATLPEYARVLVERAR